MQCPNCHNETPNGYRFCLECGEDLGAPTVVQHDVGQLSDPYAATRRTTSVVIPQPQQAPPPPPRRATSAAMFGGVVGGLFVAVLFILLLAVGYSAFTYFHGSDPLGIAFRPSQVPEQQPTPQNTPRRRTATPQPTLEPTPEPKRAPPPAGVTYYPGLVRDISTDPSETVFRTVFPRGAVAISLDGPHYGKRNYSETYVLKASAGQVFAVRLVPKGGGSPFFDVTENSTGARLSGEVKGGWAQTLPSSGDFAIRICCEGAYRLEVMIK